MLSVIQDYLLLPPLLFICFDCNYNCSTITAAISDTELQQLYYAVTIIYESPPYRIPGCEQALAFSLLLTSTNSNGGHYGRLKMPKLKQKNNA